MEKIVRMNIKKNRIIKKVAIFLGGLLIVALLCGVGYIFDQQWNIKGYSRYISLSIDSDEGLKYVKENNGITIYTYHLEDCHIMTFLTAKLVPLDDALFAKIKMKDLIKYLQEKEENNIKTYVAENYKICDYGNCFVITELNADVSEIQRALKDEGTAELDMLAFDGGS